MLHVNYNIELAAIIGLTDLKQTDPLDPLPVYIINVLAKHEPTNKLLILVQAATQEGLNKFLQDYPNAQVLEPEQELENHEEWRMLIFPTQVKDSTSPVEVFKRGQEVERQNELKLQKLS